MYKLGNYVRVGFYGSPESLYLGFGSISKIIEEPSKFQLYLKAVSFFKDTYRSIEDLINEITPYASNVNEAEKVANELLLGGFLIHSKDKVSDRYSRHCLYYNLSKGNASEIQGKLLDSHVVILGCGGIGNHVSSSLVAAGVGKITLVDADNIELSNLTRQFMFTEEDIGHNKAHTLKSRLLKINSDVEVDVLDLYIRSYSDLSKLPSCDVIVLSADNPMTISSWVNSYAISHNTAFVNVGYVVDIAVVGPFVIPGKTACLECEEIFSTTNHDNYDLQVMAKKINQSNQAPSFGPINQIASGLAAMEVIKFLGEFGEMETLNNRVGVHTGNLKIEKQTANINESCSVCQHQ